MIRKCRGPCRKPAETRQPRRDSRMIYYTCSDCAHLFPEFNSKLTSLRTVVFGKTLLSLPLAETATRKGFTCEGLA